MKRLYLLLISLFCLNINTFPQNPEWINYTNGDLINSINVEGEFIWVGTNAGLVKFDQITGNTIFFDKLNSGLPKNFITCLAVDESGNKWIGTWEGLVKFDGGEWTVYNISNSGLPFNWINCIAVDKSGNKWIGNGRWSDAEGLAKFDGTDWTIFNTSNSGLPYNYNYVRCIEIDEIGNIWIGTDEGGLAKFDGANWTVYNTSNSGLPSNRINCLTIDEAGNKWIGTRDGFAKFDGTNWEVYNQPDIGWRYNSIESIAIDKNNNVWFGSGFDNSRSGLVKYDGSDWVVYNEENSELPSKGISSIAIDESGNKWIGSYSVWGYGWPIGKGLVKFDDVNWTKILTSSSGLPASSVSCIDIDERGNKWIGTSFFGYGEGLAKFDGTSWTVYNASNSGLPSNRIDCIAIDASGNTWIGGTWAGIAMLDQTEDDLWKIYNDSVGSVNSIVFDEDGLMWVGARNGLAKFDGTNWTVYDESNSDLPDNSVSCIAIDESSNKWIGNQPKYISQNNYSGGGLVKFDGANWTVYDKSNSGLPSNDVKCIVIDDSNNIWIGTQPEYNYSLPLGYYGGGLAKFDGIEWKVFTETNSDLPDNWVNCIAIDDAGNKWIGTNSGLAKYDGTNWTVYNESNSSLVSGRINCITIDESGNKWIGTLGGLSVFNEGGVVTDIKNDLTPEAVPENYVLSQNYPNPFNPTTTIKYSIPVNSLPRRSEAKTGRQYAARLPDGQVGSQQYKESVIQNPASSIQHQVSVSLKVYNILGREVATLVNEHQRPSNYDVKWDASDHPSGVYFYTITTGDFTDTKKMLLLK